MNSVGLKNTQFSQRDRNTSNRKDLTQTRHVQTVVLNVLLEEQYENQIMTISFSLALISNIVHKSKCNYLSS